jgi:hypothetical protein
MSSSGEIIVVLIGLMLQILMRRMNGSISPQEIVRRVTAQGNAAGIRLGEVTFRRNPFQFDLFRIGTSSERSTHLLSIRAVQGPDGEHAVVQQPRPLPQPGHEQYHSGRFGRAASHESQHDGKTCLW